MGKMSDNEDEKKVLNFHQMEIDDRILKAIAKLGWITPTLIQEKAIPLLLEGKDVLLRARTGSGKTAAFSIPVIQKILNSKVHATEQLVSALILAPSKELCQQIKTVVGDLTEKCGKIIRCVDISADVEQSAQKHMLSERPDIVVSTPARILTHLKSGDVNLKKGLETLVIDEADLIFSFGFESDLKEILRYMPPIYQAILASATLSEEVVDLKKLVLHNPVTLKLQEPELAPQGQLSQYHIEAEENDKAAILYALLKLHLIRGKTIIFVNTVDRCYKLKLFLEQFGIRSCILNSELPAKIRVHTVTQFNQGKYDIIIASDEKALANPDPKGTAVTSKRRQDKESGAARGIDFQYVNNVVNFDFPQDISSYIHRAGRTARGNNTGSVLSYVNSREKKLLEKVEDHLRGGYMTDDEVIRNYKFKLDEVEAFRYRAKDAWRAITRVAVKEARLKEIKMEIFNCEKLKGFFESNPRDIEVLRHDKQLRTVKIQPHLADVPDYIVPNALKRTIGVTTHVKSKRQFTKTATRARFESKQQNPLLCADVDYAKKRRK